MITFDDLLEEAGEFGIYQKTVFFLICLATTTSSYLYVGVVLLTVTPDHWCRGPGVSELSKRCGWSLEEERNYTVPPDSANSSSYSRCERYDIEWNVTSLNCENPLSFLKNSSADLPRTTCKDGWVFEDGSFPSIVTEFGLVCADAWKVDLSHACLNLGFMIGTVLLGYGADIYGRKRIFLLSIFVTSVSGLGVAFASNYNWFIIFRIVQGLFSKGGWLSVYVLTTELVGLEYRRTVGILNQMCFSFGIIIFSAIAYLIPAWRNLQLTATIPNFCFLIYYWLIPESPRWLLSRKEKGKAMKVLQKMAKKNKHVFSRNVETVQIEDCDEELKSPSVSDLVKTPQLRKNTLILMYNWFTSSLVYLGLVIRLGIVGGNIYLNFFISGVVEIPAAIIIVLLIDRVGRRFPFVAGNLLAGACCLITAVISDGVVALIAGALVLLLPETKGITLPETIEEAENIGRKKKMIPRAVETSNNKQPASEKSFILESD
ncbi:solute carrier family 22 member 2-like isoform X2 [Heterodontus francisci]|uniref:solute carrier family 22 member 2-like isoform X2 n=1 Tax=Heterodontus francisci TaxID=7792 RepID=UPI00355BF67E